MGGRYSTIIPFKSQTSRGNYLIIYEGMISKETNELKISQIRGFRRSFEVTFDAGRHPFSLSRSSKSRLFDDLDESAEMKDFVFRELFNLSRVSRKKTLGYKEKFKDMLKDYPELKAHFDGLIGLRKANNSSFNTPEGCLALDGDASTDAYIETSKLGKADKEKGQKGQGKQADDKEALQTGIIGSDGLGGSF